MVVVYFTAALDPSSDSSSSPPSSIPHAQAPAGPDPPRGRRPAGQIQPLRALAAHHPRGFCCRNERRVQFLRRISMPFFSAVASLFKRTWVFSEISSIKTLRPGHLSRDGTIQLRQPIPPAASPAPRWQIFNRNTYRLRSTSRYKEQ